MSGLASEGRTLFRAFDSREQFTGPTMILNTSLPGDGSIKNYLTVDGDTGVRTNITGLPAVSRSSPRDYGFNPHNEDSREMSLMHIAESPGGLPFSTDHKQGINRARAAKAERIAARNSPFNKTATDVLGSGATAASLRFPSEMVRAKTPPYARGVEQKIGQRRYNVTEERPVVGSTRYENIDKARARTMAPKIPVNTVTADLFAAATGAAFEEGRRTKAFMRQARPQQLYYNDQTMDQSRQTMLNTYQSNLDEFNSDKNAMKRELLSSGLVHTTLHPSGSQDMQYQHFNNSTMRRTWYGAAPKWGVSPHVDERTKGWSGQRGDKIGQRKKDIANKPPMQSPRRGEAYGRDRRIRGKITARVNAQSRPNAGNMALSRDPNEGLMGAACDSVAAYPERKEKMRQTHSKMLAGSGNPITGALPENYNIPSFRDLELLNPYRGFSGKRR